MSEEQKMVEVPCPECGCSMPWPDRTPVDESCVICQQVAQQAVDEFAEKVKAMMLSYDELTIIQVYEIIDQLKEAN